MADSDRQDRRQTFGLTKQSSGFNPFIRGVNLGGWLLLERFITPFMFTLTDCHIKGDFCWFPGQVSAPPLNSSEHQYCDMFQCDFLMDKDTQDFSAVDEYTLASLFPNKALARQYLSYHWEYFVTKADVQALHQAGVTHVRVPVPHWIVGDIPETEPWINGQWLYFVRFAGWCREYNIQVWPDIHTAPGSQNGFDNSGQVLEDAPTCKHWGSSPQNVQRSVQVVKELSRAIQKDNLADVVTGIGVLNEPFADCDQNIVKEFYNDALKTVRDTLGEKTSVFIGDMFNASLWNDGWWTDEDGFANTYLDSHYYHVFDGYDRSLSPKQHIALVCEKDSGATQDCCYEDAPKNTIPSSGISRLVGEWSASFDTEPAYKLVEIMEDIRKNNGEASPELLNRSLTPERQSFLKHFVQAQMVAYESTKSGVSRGWFYWTLKMEFGAFAEWDFLRGLQEGWIPTLPTLRESSESIFGKCREIASKTKDDASIIHEFPDPNSLAGGALWYGSVVDDDFVLSHAGSFDKMGERIDHDDDASFADRDDGEEVPSGRNSTAGSSTASTSSQNQSSASSTTTTKTASSTRQGGDKQDLKKAPTKNGIQNWFPMFVIGFFVWAIYKVFFKGENVVNNRRQYTNLDAPTQLSV